METYFTGFSGATVREAIRCFRTGNGLDESHGNSRIDWKMQEEFYQELARLMENLHKVKVNEENLRGMSELTMLFKK